MDNPYIELDDLVDYLKSKMKSDRNYNRRIYDTVNVLKPFIQSQHSTNGPLSVESVRNEYEEMYINYMFLQTIIKRNAAS